MVKVRKTIPRAEEEKEFLLENVYETYKTELLQIFGLIHEVMGENKSYVEVAVSNVSIINFIKSLGYTVHNVAISPSGVIQYQIIWG